jgi:SAGA-associated factor 29
MFLFRQVAIKLTTSSDIILGRVICYHADIGTYDIADVDNSKRYSLAEANVAVLDLVDSSKRLSKGEDVLAVYPDTTSFYLASVIQAPRRSTMGIEPAVTVQFHGDADDLGEEPPGSQPD